MDDSSTLAAPSGAFETPFDSLGATSPTPPPPVDHYVVTRIRYELPPTCWVSEFTRKDPNRSVEVQNIMGLTPKHILGLFAIFVQDSDVSQVDWTKEIAASPDVLKVDRVELVPGFSEYIVLSHGTSSTALAREFAVVLHYPRVIRNGIITCETVARKSQLRGFMTALRDAGLNASIVSLRRDAINSSRLLFTPIQRELFHRTVMAGYFQVPRRITLTRLAQNLGRSKSSLSETLAVIERKLVDYASQAVV